MSLWLVRAGREGEFEKPSLDDRRIYLHWGGLEMDLSAYEDQGVLQMVLEKMMPDGGPERVANALGQVWDFARRMQPGDWVVLPSRLSPTLHVGEILGDYTHDPGKEHPCHWRSVHWFATDFPRERLDEDLLLSFGAFKTVSEITRSDAQSRLRAAAARRRGDPKPAFRSPTL
jgi:restriction system protein